MKKVLALVLSLLMVIGLLPMTAFAAWTKEPTITVTATEPDENGGVAVSINISESDLIVSYGLGIEYDSDVFAVDESAGTYETGGRNSKKIGLTVESDDEYFDTTSSFQYNHNRSNANSGTKIFFIADLNEEGLTEKGMTATFFFKVKEGVATDGLVSEFKLTNERIGSNNLFEVTNGEDYATYPTTNNSVKVGFPITAITLTGSLTVPAKGAEDASKIACDNENVEVKVEWSPKLVDGKFVSKTVYTATVTATPAEGAKFADKVNVTYNGDSDLAFTQDGQKLTATKTFPETADKILEKIEITTQPTKLSGYGDGDTFDTTGMVVKATYDEGAPDANYTKYTVEPTPLTKGTTEVTIKSTEDPTKTATITLREAVTGKIVKATDFTVENVTAEYTGSDLSKTLTDQIKTEVDGVSYTFKQGKDDVTAVINVGTYDIYVSVSGSNTYADTTAPIKIGTATVTPKTETPKIGTIAAQTYTGSAIEPEITVTPATLVKDTDYTVEYADNVNAGTAKVTIKAVDGSNYKFDDVSAEFTINPLEVAVTWTNTELTYTGKAQSPKASAKGVAGETIKLKVTGAGTDVGSYDASAAITSVTGGNKKADNYKLTGATTKFTIGKADYQGDAITGETTVPAKGIEGKKFELSALQLDESFKDAKITAAATEDQTLLKAAPTVAKDGLSVTFDTNEAEADTTATFTLTISSKNYNDVTATVTVTAKNIEVELEKDTYEYTGSAIEPGVTVKFAGETLAADDYKVEYKDNINVGTATVTVTLLGDYAENGSVEATFTITAKALKDADVTAEDAAYTGKAIENAVVKAGETTLVKGTDYDVEYANNIDAGTATVTVTGKGNYTGTAKTTFTINPFETAVTWTDTALTYNGEAQAPKAEAKGVEGETLVLTVSGEQTDAGESYKATAALDSVTGGQAKTANYKLTGTETTFTIAQKEVTVSGITAADKTYDGTTDATIDVSAAKFDGKLDDDVLTVTATGAFTDADAGTAKTVNLTLTLGGDDAKNYKLSDASQKTASADINPKEVTFTVELDKTTFDYNYEEQKPVVTVKDGETVLVADKDYTVTFPASSKDAGEYTVTVTGIGNYKGSTGSAKYEIKALAPSFDGAPTYENTGDNVTVSWVVKDNGSAITKLVISVTPEGDEPVEIEVEDLTAASQVLENLERGKTYLVTVTATNAIGETKSDELTIMLPVYAPTQNSYKVAVADVKNGTVTTSSEYVYDGNKVTITVTPNDGFVLESLTVTDKEGNAVELTEADGVYTFTMPASDVTVVAVFKPEHGFDDVEEDSWYEDAVYWVADNGIMEGYGNNLFGPYDNTSRAMMAQILWNMEGRPAVDFEMDYTDVADTWYTEAVRWATSVGIFKGYDDGRFGPNDDVTREQIATIMFRYAQMKGIDVSVGEDTNILSYDDAFDIGEWAIPAMQWACGSGLMEGRTASTINPKDNALRAEIAMIMMRFCTEIAK